MKKLFLVIICALQLSSISAQPEPCNPDAMTSTCLDACVVCDIDGFTGRNNLTIQGQTFSGFCTTMFHNMSYIAFIAGTVNLTLNVSVTNCNTGLGIEVGIFESLDCQTFTPVTICDTDIPVNGNSTFSNLVPLVIGQHYYLIMDGSNGDICDWTFDVISGSTLVGDLTTSGVIAGPGEICSGLTTTYTTIPEVGATIFDWTLNGVAQTNNTPELDVTFPSDGVYQLCVTASNVCDNAPPTCTTVNVVSPVPTYLIETLCTPECIEVAGDTICESGSYQYVIPLADGCDSLVFLDLTVSPELNFFIDINLCIGASFSIGNTAYSTTGVYVDTIPNLTGCDSTITLDLTMIDCELIGTVDFTPPICNGANNGSLLFAIQNGIPPFTYEWNNINNTSIGGSGSTNLLTSILIENLPAGIYEINITDSFGDDIVFIQELSDPPVLTVNIDAVDNNGYNLTCYNANDGVASVVGSGGVPPYSFMWSNNETQGTISNLSAGFYEVEVIDANGCIATANVNLTEPDLFGIMANYIDPNCDGPETGIIQLDAILGGTPPYSFSLNQSPYSSVEIFQDLGWGNYNFSVVDANGCFADTSAILYAPHLPTIYMEEAQEVDLGCSILISAQINNTSIIDISWTNIDNTLACDTCLSTNATPVNDTEYVLTVTSIDNCSTSDSILVTVNKIRDVYIPNAFSPNRDGINDYFFINANKSVSNIKTFKIFNRWGALVYEGTDLTPNQPSAGWDGYFKGKPVNPGVYVWIVELEYWDREVAILSGDVTIVK